MAASIVILCALKFALKDIIWYYNSTVFPQREATRSNISFQFTP